MIKSNFGPLNDLSGMFLLNKFTSGLDGTLPIGTRTVFIEKNRTIRVLWVFGKTRKVEVILTGKTTLDS